MKQICDSCGYKLKNHELISDNKCPICDKRFDNSQEFMNINNTASAQRKSNSSNQLKNVNDLNTTPAQIVSLKPLLIPLWILVIINLWTLSSEYLNTKKVAGVNVTPVSIVSSRTIPVSIDNVAGNIPVAIKSPLSTTGSLCANPCR